MVASILLSPYVFNKKISNKEIEQKAKAMGMIYKDEINSYDFFNDKK